MGNMHTIYIRSVLLIYQITTLTMDIKPLLDVALPRQSLMLQKRILQVYQASLHFHEANLY